MYGNLKVGIKGQACQKDKGKGGQKGIVHMLGPFSIKL